MILDGRTSTRPSGRGNIVSGSARGKGGAACGWHGGSVCLVAMQDLAISTHDATELAAAFLQAGITIGLVTVCLYLYARYHKAYFALWALAWFMYALRLGAIISFLVTENWGWLYWHQVLTGWTALAFLWAALVFSEQVQWRDRYWILVVFPPLWSYIAIYRLDEFILAAGPAVLFLSLATFWTGVVLWRHHRRLGSLPAAITAVAFFLWSLHHLDYPFLRAQGAWNPWGYYLDIVFDMTTRELGNPKIIHLNDHTGSCPATN